MDYLDPKKKKQKKINLMIMYALLGIAIAIATVVMVYLVNGYSIDRQTGEVIQNGLVYLDSKPESAEIFLNGEKQKGKTNARLVIPAGSYTFELRREGYRNWSRELTLEGGSLRQLTYARLIPEQLDTELSLELPATVTMTSQSIDKRWLVMGTNDNPLNIHVVDLNRAVKELFTIPLPLDTLDTKEPGAWTVVDWADDNKTFLAAYKTATTIEYVLIDREDGTKTKKLKTIFPTIPFSEASLRLRKNDLLYLHDKTGQKLYEANVTEKTVAQVLDGVIDYKTHDDGILYVTKTDAAEAMVSAVFKLGDKSYKLRNLKEHSSYLLNVSKQGTAFVMGIGSPVENRVIIYDDPIAALKENDFSTLPVPTTVLRVNNPEEITISADSSVILARGGDMFASHEFEADRSYNFTSNSPLDISQKLHWVDGQHFLVSSAGRLLMIDFDGSNQNTLSDSITSSGGYFDKDSNLLYSFLPPLESSAKPRLMFTHMRSAADR
jgi:hypothetical protein